MPDSSIDSKPPPPAAPTTAAGPLRWLLLAAVVVAGVWFGIKMLRETPEVGAEQGGGGGGAPTGFPPATVTVAPVEQRLARDRRTVTGTLRAVSRAEVAAREAGAVHSVAVDEGSKVEQGDVLATLDSRRLDAELAEAEARLTAAESVVDQRRAEAVRAASDLESKRALLASRAVSQREVLDAERETTVAEAGVTAAENELAALRNAVERISVRLGDLEISAPFAGRVVARHAEPGEWLVAGSPVVTLVTEGTIEAWLNVPERFADSVAEAAEELTIVAEGSGRESPATSVQILSDVDPQTRLFSVIALVDDLGGALLPGMSVRAELPVGQAAEFLAIPVDALVVTADQAFVYRPAAAAPGELPIAERITVVEQFRGDGTVYVSADDLRAGDLVVTEGNERLMPGAPLILPAASPGEPADADKPSPP